MGKRVSKWRRHEIIKLMVMAGWSSRQGKEGHFILTKENQQAITLGSDPVHKNAIADVQRGLGLHIDQVIRKKKGQPTSRNQIKKRIVLAKQMDAAGFGSDIVLRNCSLNGLYEAGFSFITLRDRDPEDYANELYKSLMAKKGVKIVKEPKKVDSPVGSGKLPPVDMSGLLTEEKPPTPNGDMNALLELMSVFGSQLEDIQTDGNKLSGILTERLKHAKEQAKHVKYLHLQYTEALDKLVTILEEPV